MMGPLFEARAAARGSSLSITVLIAERRRAVLSKRAAVCPFLPAHMTLAAADCRAAPPGCPVALDEVRAENQFQIVEGEVRRAARVAEDREESCFTSHGFSERKRLLSSPAWPTATWSHGRTRCASTSRR